MSSHGALGHSVRLPVIALALLCGSTTTVAARAQTPRPLDKVEMIRLLTNPLFAQSEVADVVRRSCVGFRPTERDWADLRHAGASSEVIASVEACTTRRAGSAPATAPAPPPAALTAVGMPAEVVAIVGSPSRVRVFVHRGGVPQRRVPLTLRGTSILGLQRDAPAVTDDSGMAVFHLPPAGEPGRHRFEIVLNSGATLPERSRVLLVVRQGEPARLRVTPDFIASPDRGATVVATVTDSLGNALVDEAVELSSAVGAVGASTDSLGRARFVLAPDALPRGSTLQVRVRKLSVVNLAVAEAAGLSGAETGFVRTGERRGRVGTALSDPLAFRARTVQGDAPSGRVVRFRAVNASVKPDSAVLDSTGAMTLDVVLGTRSGEALVFATIDSVEKVVTFQVDPAPPASLVIEHNGQAVTGREVVVRVGTPFVLRVTARDDHGNETSIEALAQLLRARRAQLESRQRYLELVSLDAGDAAVLVTLKANRIGTIDFTIGSGITASVRVKAVAR